MPRSAAPKGFERGPPHPDAIEISADVANEGLEMVARAALVRSLQPRRPPEDRLENPPPWPSAGSGHAGCWKKLSQSALTITSPRWRRSAIRQKASMPDIRPGAASGEQASPFAAANCDMNRQASGHPTPPQIKFSAFVTLGGQASRRAESSPQRPLRLAQRSNLSSNGHICRHGDS